MVGRRLARSGRKSGRRSGRRSGDGEPGELSGGITPELVRRRKSVRARLARIPESVVGRVSLLFVVGVFTVFLTSRIPHQTHAGTSRYPALKVGDCFTKDSDPVIPVPCDSPHDAQVYEVLPMSSLTQCGPAPQTVGDTVVQPESMGINQGGVAAADCLIVTATVTQSLLQP